jgi:hypothetical protein
MSLDVRRPGSRAAKTASWRLPEVHDRKSRLGARGDPASATAAPRIAR